MCSLQLLFRLLRLFIRCYFDFPSRQHRFVFPIAVAISYLKFHPSLLDFTWNVHANYPVSRDALETEIRRFADDVVTKEWSGIKKQGFYGNEAIPCVLTHLEGIVCLKEVRDGIASLSDTSAIIGTLVRAFPFDEGSPVFEDAGDEEKQWESDDSLQEFLSSMADDVFMDKAELERCNSDSRTKTDKYKARRATREQKRLRKTVHQPEWSAQNLRKVQPPTKEEFRLLQRVNRTNINPKVRSGEWSLVVVLDRAGHFEHSGELRTQALRLQGHSVGDRLLHLSRSQGDRFHAPQIHRWWGSSREFTNRHSEGQSRVLQPNGMMIKNHFTRRRLTTFRICRSSWTSGSCACVRTTKTRTSCSTPSRIARSW